jgi:ubiquinone/menaquinone biosynthesis C-methylase UbiE
VEEDKIKKIVRKGYAKVAKQEGSCCGGSVCTDDVAVLSERVSKSIGYSDEELGSVPEGANMGLGCGNPVALASLKEGETVLDLGSGGGLDCFLAASKVGDKGKVIGVDMTPEMIDKARENARKGKRKNVEFRLGEIENLPVADNSVDVVVSNCVINLSADKPRVFEEAFRVLKPGGHLMVSDIVQLKELPSVVKKSVEAYVGCLSGAIMKQKYLETIRKAGFEEVKVMEESQFPVEYMANDPTAKAAVAELGWTSETVKDIANAVASVKVYGKKPEG